GGRSQQHIDLLERLDEIVMDQAADLLRLEEGVLVVLRQQRALRGDNQYATGDSGIWRDLAGYCGIGKYRIILGRPLAPWRSLCPADRRWTNSSLQCAMRWSRVSSRIGTR